MSYRLLNIEMLLFWYATLAFTGANNFFISSWLMLATAREMSLRYFEMIMPVSCLFLYCNGTSIYPYFSI